MIYGVTVTVRVDADCSRAAVAAVLACVSTDLVDLDVQVDPHDDSIPVGDEIAFSSAKPEGP